MASRTTKHKSGLPGPTTVAALTKAGALQRAIFESVSFSMIASDANGVIQLFNAGAERMLGYTAVEMINKLTPADISDPQELIVRANALTRENKIVIAPGFEALVFRASRGIEDIYELTYCRKDGSRLPAVVSVTALRDAEDRVIGYLLIFTDNTARKLVEDEKKKLDESLREQQFYTRSLIEANIDALMTTDPVGIISDVNKQMEALTGCTRDELIGSPFKGYFTDPERADAGIQLVLSERKVTDYELTVRSREGGKTDVSYNATTFYDRSRALKGVFAAARDVTGRKRVEAELKQAKAVAESASRSKSDFLASMSHEMRTPMHALMGIADLLAKTNLSVEQAKFVQIFQRAGDNLLNLVNDILDLSKVESSQLELEHTGFSLRELLEKVSEMVALRAEEKGLSLVFDVARDVPPDLIGDPTRVRQVLLNLLGNAIKFTDVGEVCLRVSLDGSHEVPTLLRFAVSDTGIGIPAEKTGQVFERFRQADSSTTRRFGGSGLGLTISKRLVELMGGRIWVESVAGQGSVFSFAVPFERWVGRLNPDDVEVGLGPELPLPALKILLVEDSADNCTITLAYLEGTPYRVEIAETGAIACKMFVSGDFDLVLMDRQMPVMDGLTATRTIRAWEKEHGRAPTPIIALTASALKGDREKCLAAGCTGFLTKPIKQEVLLQAIRENARRVIRSPAVTSPGLLHPRIAARVPAFLEERRLDVSTLRRALARGDFEIVTGIGHNMKGTGTSFGFPLISEIGAALEREASRSALKAAQEHVAALSDYLTTLDNDARAVVSASNDPYRSLSGRVAKIVLVDDNDELRMALGEILEDSGHRVRTARNGVDGLAVILSDRPDVAFVDVGLPKIDGYEVARKVRSALGHTVVLVAMTGNCSEDDRMLAMTAGFDKHIRKPIDVQQLERSITELLKSKQ